MKCKACTYEFSLSSKCNFYQYDLCEEHRLPENHSCDRASPSMPLRSWISKQSSSEKPNRQESEFVSEGDFNFVKEQLATFKMPKKKKRFGFLTRKKIRQKEIIKATS